MAIEDPGEYPPMGDTWVWFVAIALLVIALIALLLSIGDDD